MLKLKNTNCVNDIDFLSLCKRYSDPIYELLNSHTLTFSHFYFVHLFFNFRRCIWLLIDLLHNNIFDSLLLRCKEVKFKIQLNVENTEV
jgi:hypothetical protein